MFLVKAILIKDIVATTVAYNVAKKSLLERWDLTHFTKLPTTENLGRADLLASIPAIASSRARLKSNNKDKIRPKLFVQLFELCCAP